MTVKSKPTPAADAYDTHAKYWADSGGDLQIPVDPFVIASSMGIRVYPKILGPSHSGYLTTDSTGLPVIYINEAHGLNRQRFTVAHELGHYVDARNRRLLPNFGTFDRDRLSSAGTDATEVYANRFAAALLMPRLEVEQLVEKGLTVTDLARRFRVSPESMEWRLQNLGLWTRVHERS